MTRLEHLERHPNPFRRNADYNNQHDQPLEGRYSYNSGAELTNATEKRQSPKVPLRERLKHFTWAWFTLTMSTGGIALLLQVTPHRFPHLTTLGTIVYVIDLVFFVALCIGMIIRLSLDPRAFKQSFLHPSESLLFPTFWLSMPTIIGCMQEYGVPSSGPWLVVTVRVLFWLYVACTFLVGVVQYFLLFSAKELTVHSMTPAWIMPIFPIMLSGTLAGIIAGSQPPSQSMPIIIAGFTFQSLGFMVATFMYANYIGRMMQYGFPAPSARGTMFISVGPPSFTGLAYINLATSLPQDYSFLASHPGAYDTLVTIATFSAIFLWSLAFWFFSISLLAVSAGARQMRFSLTWWSFVFPNTGFVIITTEIGTQLASEGILWIASIMTILLVAAWLIVLCCHVYAVCTSRILYPGKDEDA